MKKLSILIPTYNRKDRLKKTFHEIISNQSNEIEFIIIDNNSNDGTEEYIKNYSINDNRIKYYKNYTNLGPNRTLYRGLLESSGEWITIFPDDDYIPREFIDELLVEIERYSDCGLIITSKNKQKPLFPRTTKVSGIEALKTAYLHSSTITGISWNKKHINEPGWLLDGNIYPQVRVSCEIAINNDLVYFVPNNQPKILNWDEDKLFSLSRPKDFGFFELINLLDELKYKNYLKESDKVYFLCSASRFAWISNVFIEMLDESEEMAKEFFKTLVSHTSIRSSVLFWLIFINNYYKSKANIGSGIFLSKYLFIGIFKSIFNKNLYLSSIFLIKNSHSLRNKYKTTLSNET